MSCNAYSRIFVGVSVEVQVDSCQKIYNRFNPTTGVPFELEAEARDIRLILGDVTISLPDDDQVAEEEIKKDRFCSSLDSWFHERTESRICDYLQDHDIGLDEDEGDLSHIWVDESRILIGEVILTGTNYSGWGDNESYREIPLLEIPRSTGKIQDHLFRHFQARVLAKPYLITKLSC